MVAANNSKQINPGMKLLKRYRFIIIGLIALLALILIRSFGTGHFRYDAKRWTELSTTGENILNKGELSALTGDKLIVYLTTETDYDLPFAGTGATIAADSVLTPENKKALNSHKGPVILYSNDISVSARVWMVLSQTGIKNIYILDTSVGNERPIK